MGMMDLGMGEEEVVRRILSRKHSIMIPQDISYIFIILPFVIMVYTECMPQA